jgi:hypothetical protein
MNGAMTFAGCRTELPAGDHGPDLGRARRRRRPDYGPAGLYRVTWSQRANAGRRPR